jgi:hypothetical protein
MGAGDGNPPAPDPRRNSVARYRGKDAPGVAQPAGRRASLGRRAYVSDPEPWRQRGAPPRSTGPTRGRAPRRWAWATVPLPRAGSGRAPRRSGCAHSPHGAATDAGCNIVPGVELVGLASLDAMRGAARRWPLRGRDSDVCRCSGPACSKHRTNGRVCPPSSTDAAARGRIQTATPTSACSSEAPAGTTSRVSLLTLSEPQPGSLASDHSRCE